MEGEGRRKEENMLLQHFWCKGNRKVEMLIHRDGKSCRKSRFGVKVTSRTPLQPCYVSDAFWAPRWRGDLDWGPASWGEALSYMHK